MTDTRAELIASMEKARQEAVDALVSMKERHQKEKQGLRDSLHAIETGLRGLKGEPIKVYRKPEPDEPKKGKK